MEKFPFLIKNIWFYILRRVIVCSIKWKFYIYFSYKILINLVLGFFKLFLNFNFQIFNCFISIILSSFYINLSLFLMIKIFIIHLIIFNWRATFKNWIIYLILILWTNLVCLYSWRYFFVPCQTFFLFLFQLFS
jgi:hypothetical protein